MNLCRAWCVFNYKDSKKSLSKHIYNTGWLMEAASMMKPLIRNGLTCPNVISSARLLALVAVSLTFNLNDVLALRSRSRYNGLHHIIYYGIRLAMCCPVDWKQLHLIAAALPFVFRRRRKNLISFKYLTSMSFSLHFYVLFFLQIDFYVWPGL